MITQEQINQVFHRIVENYHPNKIILFGSYASGNPNKDSDLDLLIIKDDNMPKIYRNRLVRSYLNDIMFPVDIIVKTPNEYETLKDVIGTIVYAAQKYGKVIYG